MNSDLNKYNSQGYCSKGWLACYMHIVSNLIPIPYDPKACLGITLVILLLGQNSEYLHRKTNYSREWAQVTLRIA